MKLTNKIIFLLIIIVAIVLRFYHYFEIPFTHDEFSALFRLRFDSFSELIDKGVKVDGHPAGIQVFLFYWTKLFGIQEWVVKLPFTIFGLLSVYLIYLIGKKWFNSTVGLLSAAYLASIQFTVMYSQIARPYISGLFFSLLMVYVLSNIIFNPEKKLTRNLLLFSFSTALTVYNHYFSMLFAVIVAFSGFFFIKRKYLVRYLLAGVLIIVLFSPHLKVFLYQLNVGGLSWLGKPGDDFLIKFVYFIFNYSPIVILVTLFLVIMSFINSEKSSKKIKLIIISFIWFLLPFLIGFIYSRKFSPVLQYSVLIFSFPFLFFVLFGFIKEQKANINFLLVILVLSANILSLTHTRKHYDVFYKSIYKQILVDYKYFKEKNEKTIFLVENHPKINKYYAIELNIDTNYVSYSKDLGNIKSLKSFLKENSKSVDKLYFGCLSNITPNIVPQIQEFFPKIEVQNNYFLGTTYLFSKEKTDSINQIVFLDFDAIVSESWSNVDTSRILSNADSTNNNCFLYNSKTEWGTSFETPLWNIIKNKYNFIDISVKFKSTDSIQGIMLVASLDADGKNYFWRSSNFSDFADYDTLSNEWTHVYLSLKLSDINIKNEDLILTTYVWNKGKRTFVIDDFKIALRDGNPRVYGIYNKLIE